MNRRKHSVAIVLSAVAATALSIPGFVWTSGGTVRYAPVVLRAVDPQLFPNDPVVASFARFGSVLYPVLGAAMRVLGLQAEDLPRVLMSLAAATTFATAVSLGALCLRLGGGPAAAIVAAFLPVAAVASPLGGVSLFSPSFDHTHPAVLLGLLALLAWLRGRYLMAGLCLGLAMPIHPLVAGHLALVLVLDSSLRLFSRRPAWRRTVRLAVPVGLAGLAYVAACAPPGLSQTEMATFLAAKGSSAHIDAFQNPWGWSRLLGLAGLACVLGSDSEAPADCSSSPRWEPCCR